MKNSKIKIKPNLYNDLHPGTSTSRTGFKNEKIAFDTIKNISKRSLRYQFDVINTMYNRAKFHPNQTVDMKKAMEVFFLWLEKYKKKKELENKKYPWISFDTLYKYEKINKSNNIFDCDSDCKKFLSVYKKFNDKLYKLQYIKYFQNDIIYDYWSYRIEFIKEKLKLIKKFNYELYYKTGKYKNLPTRHHIELILHGFSPDKNIIINPV